MSEWWAWLLRSDKKCDYKRSWPLFFPKVEAKKPESIMFYTATAAERTKKKMKHRSFHCPHQWSVMEGFEIGDITLCCVSICQITQKMMYQDRKCVFHCWVIVRSFYHCEHTCSQSGWLTLSVVHCITRHTKEKKSVGTTLCLILFLACAFYWGDVQIN